MPISHHWALCRVTSQSYVMLCYVMLCYVMLCYVMVWYGMAWHGMVWYGMVWYVMLCNMQVQSSSSRRVSTII